MPTPHAPEWICVRRTTYLTKEKKNYISDKVKEKKNYISDKGEEELHI